MRTTGSRKPWPALAVAAICLAAIGFGLFRLMAWIRPPDPVYLNRDQALARVLEPGVCGSSVRVSYHLSSLARQHGRALTPGGRLLYPATGDAFTGFFAPREFWVAELRATGSSFDIACSLVLDAESGAILRESGSTIAGDPSVGGGS